MNKEGRRHLKIIPHLVMGNQFIFILFKEYNYFGRIFRCTKFKFSLVLSILDEFNLAWVIRLVKWKIPSKLEYQRETKFSTKMTLSMTIRKKVGSDCVGSLRIVLSDSLIKPKTYITIYYNAFF